jgi:hypothetical protein
METKQLIIYLQQIINQEETADPHPLLQNALTAYQTARTDGLCHEGAYEIALQTLQNSP